MSWSVGLVTRGCGFESRLRQELSTTEVRPLSKAPNLQTTPRAPQHWLPTALGVCALGWVKCSEHISLLVILCIIVYVTNKKFFFFFIRLLLHVVICSSKSLICSYSSFRSASTLRTRCWRYTSHWSFSAGTDTDDIRWILTLKCSAISPWSLTFQVPLDIIPSVEIVLCGLLSSSLTWIRFSSGAPGHMFGVIFIVLFSQYLGFFGDWNTTCSSKPCVDSRLTLWDEILFHQSFCDVF